MVLVRDSKSKFDYYFHIFDKEILRIKSNGSKLSFLFSFIFRRKCSWGEGVLAYPVLNEIVYTKLICTKLMLKLSNKS